MTTDAEVLELIQDYVCQNQSSLVEYLFLANRKHQALREALSSKSNKEELKSKIIELEDHFQTKFTDIFQKNCEYILKYFSQELCSKRSSIPVRIAIKVIAYDQIVSLERFPFWEFEDVESETVENSAFEYLSQPGSPGYYICNDIPKAIELGNYKNNRIDIKKAQEYIHAYTYGNIKRDLDLADIEWAKCWKPIRHKVTGEKRFPPPPESCYKSTIVLPISLHSKDINSVEFKIFFNLDSGPVKPEGKVILGYLCLDHPVAQYFREDTDVRLADIFSKFLSLYMLPELGYTQYSSTYFNAFKEIGELNS